MLFLADESCDLSVVRALRTDGHDVIAVAEIAPRADDEAVLDLARAEERILLTEDKDFGRLVYADGRASGGVILGRYPASARGSLPGDVLQLVAARGTDLVGRFVVMRPGRVRLGPKKS